MYKTEKYVITFYNIPIYLNSADTISSIWEFSAEETYKIYKKYIPASCRTEIIACGKCQKIRDGLEYAAVITCIRDPDEYQSIDEYSMLLKEVLNRFSKYADANNYIINVYEVGYSKFIYDGGEDSISE